MMLPSNDPEMYRRMSGGAPFASTGGGGFGGNPMISDMRYRGPYGGGFNTGGAPFAYTGGGFGGGFGGGLMSPFPPRRPSPYRNPYYMEPVYGGGMGQVRPTNIPFRDPGYGSPMLTQNLIQSLGGPQTSFRNTYRPYSTLGMLDRFRGGNMGSPFPMPYPPMPSPGGKGGRMPMPGMPGKGGRSSNTSYNYTPGYGPGMPGKGGQMPPDQGMPPTGGEMPPEGGGMPPAEIPPAGGGTPETGTPPADTTPANNLTDAQRNILAEQGFTEQEARDAFDAIIQNRESTLDPRFRDLIGTGYYRRIGEAFGLKDALGNPVTLGGETAVQGIDFPGQIITRKPSEDQLAQFQQNIPQTGAPEESPPADAGSGVVDEENPYLASLTPEQRAAIDQIRQGGFNPFSMGIGGLYGVGGGMIPNFSGMRF